jgi:hypothetical protein
MKKPGDIKRLILSRPVLIIIVLLLVLTAAITVTCFQSYTVLVKDRDGGFYMARSLVILGDTMLCIKSGSIHHNRKEALEDPMGKTSLTSVSISSVAFIEIIAPTEEEAEPSPGTVPPQFLGSFNIVAAAHRGYLQLWSRDGRVYGSIRFPNWARGKVEYLKGVSISGNNIRFVRSVTTREVQVRIGSSTYFTQVYYGTYYSNGRLIKGYYTRDGHRGLWEAKKGK